MATVEDVIKAHAEIAKAEARYRDVLREALKVRGTQARLVEALGVTREKLRQDSLPESDREKVREADARRKAAIRDRARANQP